MRKWMIVTAMLLAGVASMAQASGGVTVRVSATIQEVQCTPEQRTRIRACASSDQSIAPAPYKTVSAVQTSTQLASYQIEVDSTRQVMIRTVLY
jgi:hypothetical protein